MATITFTIPDGKLERVTNAIKGNHKIPEIPDPQDPDNMIPEFTPNQWAKEYLVRYIKREVQILMKT